MEGSIKINDMKNFKTPELFDCDGDTNKRWFVAYWFRNPETDKMERHRIWISSKLNTKTARRNKARELIDVLTIKLNAGWSPYAEEVPEFTPLVIALEKIVQIKSAQSKNNTASNYKSAAKKITDYLTKKAIKQLPCIQFNDKIARDFMDNLSLTGIGNRTFNNILCRLRTIFNELIVREYFTINPFGKIKKLPQDQGSITPFDKSDFNILYDYLEQNDKYLLLFVKFIYYCGFRPVEITRIKIGDIDFVNGSVTLQAQYHKTRRQRGMKLKKSFLKDLEHLSDYNSNCFVFSKNMLPGKVYCDPRRIQERYKEIKDKLKLTNRLYDFKHTMACYLIRQKVDIMAVKNYLGHQDISDTMIYIRSVEEYSSDTLKDIIPDMDKF